MKELYLIPKHTFERKMKGGNDKNVWEATTTLAPPPLREKDEYDDEKKKKKKKKKKKTFTV